jgi:hypothetical protein
MKRKAPENPFDDILFWLQLASTDFMFMFGFEPDKNIESTNNSAGINLSEQKDNTKSAARRKRHQSLALNTDERPL